MVFGFWTQQISSAACQQHNSNINHFTILNKSKQNGHYASLTPMEGFGSRFETRSCRSVAYGDQEEADRSATLCTVGLVIMVPGHLCFLGKQQKMLRFSISFRSIICLKRTFLYTCCKLHTVHFLVCVGLPTLDKHMDGRWIWYPRMSWKTRRARELGALCFTTFQFGLERVQIYPGKGASQVNTNNIHDK